ncbi:MAG: energy transducer TonB [Bacteroidales bacterium]|nr:energy transducer TonB [Bacteroidales bacterium]
MNKLLSILALLILAISSQAQNNQKVYAIGEYISMGKQIIPGYYDKHTRLDLGLDLWVKHRMKREFTPAYYYDSNGEKNKGLIKLTDSISCFRFKHNEDSAIKYIEAKDCRALVMGVDSFAIVKDFYVEYKLAHFKCKINEFARVIYERNDTVVYEHKRIGLKDNVWTILYKLPGSDSLYSFSKRDVKFKEQALKFFADWEYMINAINENMFEPFYCRKMIELYKFHKLYMNQGKIYYTSSWEEASNPELYAYYGLVNHEVTGKFYVTYYHINGIPLYSGSYSSLYKKEEDGKFQWYSPYGSVRKSAVYKKGYLGGTIHVFYPEGNVHYEFRPLSEPYFKNVWTEEGEKILTSGSGKDSFYDPALNRTIHREYKNGRLVCSYAEQENGDLVYQVCRKDSKLLKSLDYIKRKVIKEIRYSEQALAKAREGILLLKVVVGVDGYVKETVVVKGIEASLDSQVLDLFETIKEKKFGAASHNKTKVKQEILLPIEFSIFNSYGYPPSEKEKFQPPNMMPMVPVGVPGF